MAIVTAPNLIKQLRLICITIQDAWPTSLKLSYWAHLKLRNVSKARLRTIYEELTWSFSKRFNGIIIRHIPFWRTGTDWNTILLPKLVWAIRIRSFWLMARVFMASNCSSHGLYPNTCCRVLGTFSISGVRSIWRIILLDRASSGSVQHVNILLIEVILTNYSSF